MSKKTISTPDLFAVFAGDSNSSSRGVSEVVGTASLVVLTLGLVGGVATGLGGVTDGINNNGLDGEIQFNQDGGEITITVNSVSDDVNSLSLATDGNGTFSQNSPSPSAGTIVTDSSGGFVEGDTITVTASDDDGNSQVIAQFTFGSVS